MEYDELANYMHLQLGVAQIGNVRWVSTSGSDSTGTGSYQKPYKTINYAVTTCVENNNDVVAVKPGTYEESTTYLGVSVGVAGIIIVGGANPAQVVVSNNKTGVPVPKSVFYIKAANVTICNLTISGVLGSVTGIQSAAENTIIQNVTFKGTMRNGVMTFNHTVVRDCWLEGMTMDGVQLNFAYGLIEHNHITGVGSTAINIMCKADGHHNMVIDNSVNGAGVTQTGISAIGDNNLIAGNVVGGCATWHSDTGVGNFWIDNKTE